MRYYLGQIVGVIMIVVMLGCAIHLHFHVAPRFDLNGDGASTVGFPVLEEDFFILRPEEKN